MSEEMPTPLYRHKPASGQDLLARRGIQYPWGFALSAPERGETRTPGETAYGSPGHSRSLPALAAPAVVIGVQPKHVWADHSDCLPNVVGAAAASAAAVVVADPDLQAGALVGGVAARAAKTVKFLRVWA